MNKQLLTIGLALFLFMSFASASEVNVDRLNWFAQEQHTVNITNTLTGTVNAVATMPTGFTFVSSASGCTNPSGQTINCNSIASDGSAVYIIQSPSSGTEYSLLTLNTTLNGTALNDVEFLNIKDQEIFNTLIEFGRGNGNYFFNSAGGEGSAGTGTGYNYLPNGSDFELNYLHKVFNIKQYFGLAYSRATDVQFTCEYPYQTVVRTHLVSAISDDSTTWTINYALPRIDGSWERMSYVGMNFEVGAYDVGDTFNINCSNLQYTLADAYGNLVVDADNFNMEIRDPNALGVTVASNTAQIGNGTSEVEIAYTLTNNEVYPMDKVVIEIDAPENAQFIGVRGELWGAARDKYRYELTEMDAGQVEVVTLVARFDTSLSADTTLLLTQGIKAQFTPTWEINAYNPRTYIQELAPTDTQAVNYGSSASINSIQTQITNIESTTTLINTTVNTIQTTTNTIQTLVEQINGTTITTGENLLLINASLTNQITNNYNNLNSTLNDLSTEIANFETNMQSLVNCTSSPTAPLCAKIDVIDANVDSLVTDLALINISLVNEINTAETNVLNGLTTNLNAISNNFTYTNNLILSMNASLSSEIGSLNLSGANVTVDFSEVTNLISSVNSTIVSIEGDIATLSTDLSNINTSLSNQMSQNTTAIINAVNNGFSSITTSTAEILTELSYMQDFNEELVFLVTDSVGLATESKMAMDNGQPEVAIVKLQEAESKLAEAQNMMDKEKKPLENKIKIEQSNIVMKVFYKVKGLFL